MSGPGAPAVVAYTTGVIGGAVVVPVLKEVAQDPDLFHTVVFWVWAGASLVLCGTALAVWLLPGLRTEKAILDSAAARRKVKARHATSASTVPALEEVERRLAAAGRLEGVPNWREDADAVEDHTAQWDAARNAAKKVADADAEVIRARWARLAVPVSLMCVLVVFGCLVPLYGSADANGQSDTPHRTSTPTPTSAP